MINQAGENNRDQPGYHSGLMLGQIITKLDNVQLAVTENNQKTEQYSTRLNSVEKELISLQGTSEQMKKKIDAPPTPWWSIAAGIGSIGSIITVLIVILPILAGMR